MTKVTMIPLDQIAFDPDFYPRCSGEADWQTVMIYHQAIQTNPWKADYRKKHAFPPITVTKPPGFQVPFLGLDGLHRLGAWKAAKFERIPAFIENLPKSMWLRRATELNLISQRPLNSRDKTRLIAKFREEGWEKEKISGFLMIKMESCEKMVHKGLVKLSNKAAKKIPKGPSNQLIGINSFGFLKAPFHDSEDRATALMVQSPVAAMNVDQIMDSFIAVLESRCIDLSQSQDYEKLQYIQELVDDYLD
jgi:hypothetical protein